MSGWFVNHARAFFSFSRNPFHSRLISIQIIMLLTFESRRNRSSSTLRGRGDVWRISNLSHHERDVHRQEKREEMKTRMTLIWCKFIILQSSSTPNNQSTVDHWKDLFFLFGGVLISGLESWSITISLLVLPNSVNHDQHRLYDKKGILFK